MLFKTLLGEERVRTSPVLRPGRERVADVIFTTVAVLPALAIAFGIRDVSLLVKITGSYPGLTIMFIAPALMVFFARRKAARELGETVENPHTSPFRHTIWVVIVWLFSAAAIGLISYNMFTAGASDAPADYCVIHRNHTAPVMPPMTPLQYSLF